MDIIATLDTLDKNVFLALNGCHNSFFDSVMYAISGTKIWIPLYIFIIWQISRKRKWDTFLTVFFLVIMVVLSDQISNLIKHEVMRLRPSHNPAFEGVIHLVSGYRGGNYGFVSSHAANTFALAIFVSLFFRKNWVSFSIFAWAILVSYSRIYLGVHYPFDVLGGAVVGLVAGVSMYYLEQLFFTKKYFHRKPR